METKISSSEGYLIIDSKTGEVESLVIERGRAHSYLRSVKKIDVKEYKGFYGVKELPNDIDILDVSYWWYQYSPREKRKDMLIYDRACAEWRIETIELRKDC